MGTEAQLERRPSSNAALEREPISAFVICYNEETQIGDCLRSLTFCDEVTVIDSFSTDKTVEIAKEFGAKVVQREWPGYCGQKAFGLSATTHEWVLNIDADERVTPELRDEVLRVLREDYLSESKNSSSKQEEITGYEVNRVVFHLGRWWRRGGWYPEYRLRLMRKSHAKWGGIDPHERPIVDGRIARLKGELEHYTYSSLDDQFSRLHSFSSLAAQEEFKRGKKVGVFSLVFNPVVRFVKFYFLKKGFREGTAGLIVASAEAYYTFMKYAKLWECYFNEDKRQKQKQRQVGR